MCLACDLNEATSYKALIVPYLTTSFIWAIIMKPMQINNR